jgi:hypothetical protein
MKEIRSTCVCLCMHLFNEYEMFNDEYLMDLTLIVNIDLGGPGGNRGGGGVSPDEVNVHHKCES